ncbi:AbrB/MazE/SpoVT family DNA-binding domain-containing protein [Bacillus horti]|uniref:Antitoxin MazE n=1 Tax=Caldalkalibacillus horti TaxID=77523 RepID=A0ABT9VZ06_9BACI|nr:AbrB/MazE/SpoVT family DNA-binding domain-containing protein [Bacillus horti]MDQ0166225.1 antitoxin MazE [Bacillus horti]
MAVKNMERKITKIGRSIGVTFPLDMLKAAGLKPGDIVSIEQKGEEIILRKSRKIELPEGIDQDFFDLFEETYQEYEETIKGLVDR